MNREQRTKRNEAMKAYKAEGHSMKEVAVHFGVSEGVVQQVCKGIAIQSQRRPEHLANQYTADTEKARQSRLNRIRKTIAANAPGFEYAGGYTDGHGMVQIRCTTCGCVRTLFWNNLRHKEVKGKKAVCQACVEAKRNEAKARKKAEKEAIQKAKEEKRKQKALDKAKQMEFAICKECGELFVKTAKNKAYCSPECARRQQYNHKDRRLKGVKRDSGITLMRVFQRDGGRCHLCGGMCNWADKGEKGTGNSYPSIDHVIPIARGGTHTWDNVKLAHRICNTVKSDTLPGANASVC